MSKTDKIDFKTASGEIFKGIRSEKTRNYIILILETLINESKRNEEGAVRATELQKMCVGEDKIQHIAVFYRLLKKLVENKIIYELTVNKPRGPGRAPKYYAVYDGFNPLILESRNSLLDRCMFLEKRIKDAEEILSDYKLKYQTACKLLEEKGMKNPEEKIEDLLYG